MEKKLRGGKQGDHAQPAIFIGYADEVSQQKGYILQRLSDGNIMVKRHVYFDESRFPLLTGINATWYKNQFTGAEQSRSSGEDDRAAKRMPMNFEAMGEYDPTYFEPTMSSNISSGWNEAVIANTSGQQSKGQEEIIFHNSSTMPFRQVLPGIKPRPGPDENQKSGKSGPRAQIVFDNVDDDDGRMPVLDRRSRLGMLRNRTK